MVIAGGLQLKKWLLLSAKNADEAASIYARALAVVSLDRHSPIIALAAGTPAIHLRVPTDDPHKSRMLAVKQGPS